MQALAIMYHDVVENEDFGSSGFPGEGAHVYKLRREDFERHLDAIAAATTAVGTVSQLDGRPVRDPRRRRPARAARRRSDRLQSVALRMVAGPA